MPGRPEGQHHMMSGDLHQTGECHAPSRHVIKPALIDLYSEEVKMNTEITIMYI